MDSIWDLFLASALLCSESLLFLAVFLSCSLLQCWGGGVATIDALWVFRVYEWGSWNTPVETQVCLICPRSGMLTLLPEAPEAAVGCEPYSQL